MSTNIDPLAELELPDQHRVNAVCDRFEEALQQGRDVPLEAFLTDTSGHMREVLFRELLLLECEHTLRRGADVNESLLAQRFPDRMPSVRETVNQAKCNLLVEAAVAEPTHGSPLSAAGIPDMFGRFRLLAVVGHGAFGTVFRAVDTISGDEVAVKIPHLVTLVSPDLRERFFREARAAAALRHPRIVRLLEVGEEGLVCFIASEFVPGSTLAAWLSRCYEKQERISFDTAARLVAELAAAMQYAHEHGVFHCDLKPANVLLRGGASPIHS